MTKLNTPTASEPILFDTYKLNTIPMALMINKVTVNMIPFIKKIFVLFTKYHHLIVLEVEREYEWSKKY